MWSADVSTWTQVRVAEARCHLCYETYRRPGDQDDITGWIKQHLQDFHLGDDVEVAYVIEKALLPRPKKVLSDEEKAEMLAWSLETGGIFAIGAEEQYRPKALRACRCNECDPRLPSTAGRPTLS
jgi:hypothetical protein